MPTAVRFISRIQDADDYGDDLWFQGRISIGTSSTAGEEVHVQGADNVYVRVESTGADSDAGIELANDAVEWHARVFGAAADNFMVRDETNDTNPFRIEANTPSNTLFLEDTGNVGIGTNSPGAKLEISLNEDGQEANLLQLSRTTSSPADNDFMDVEWWHENDNNQQFSAMLLRMVVSDISDTTEDTYGQFNTYVAGSLTPALVFGYGANNSVGIGTSSPGGLLEIAGATPHAIINATSGDPWLWFEENGTWKYAWSYSTVNNRLRLHSTDTDGGGTDGDILRIADGTDDVYFLGSVGIGTASPEALLHVVTAASATAPAAAADEALFENTGDCGITITAGASDTANVYFGKDTVGSGRGRVVYANSTEKLSFYTAASQQVAIDSDGNVGIGTASPGSHLEIAAAAATAEINATSGNPSLYFVENETWRYRLSYEVGSNYFFLRSTDTDGGGTDGDIFRVYDGTAEVNFIADVGFGTRYPYSPVSAYRAPSDTVGDVSVGLTYSTDAVDNLWGFRLSATSYNFNIDRAYSGWQSAALTIERSTGYVGIGTDSPSNLLTAYGGSLPLCLYRPSSTASSGVGIQFDLNDDGAAQSNYASIYGLIKANAAGSESGALAFYTNNAGSDGEKMRIDNDGNVGIGTDSPGTLLEMAGASPMLTINATSGNPVLMFETNGSFVYWLGYDVTNTRLYLRSTDSDGGGTDDDIWRIPDGQTTIDANTTWDENVFDYVCQDCGWHSGNETDTCPECGGVVAWQDDAALVHSALHAPDKGHFLRKLEQQGLLDLSDAESTDTGYKNVFMSLQGMQQFSLSAVAQLWATVQQQAQQISELEARL